MKSNVVSFRTLKHGDPERKMQMILDAPPKRAAVRNALFFGLVAAAVAGGYVIVSLAMRAA